MRLPARNVVRSSLLVAAAAALCAFLASGLDPLWLLTLAAGLTLAAAGARPASRDDSRWIWLLRFLAACALLLTPVAMIDPELARDLTLFPWLAVIASAVYGTVQDFRDRRRTRRP